MLPLTIITLNKGRLTASNLKTFNLFNPKEVIVGSYTTCGFTDVIKLPNSNSYSQDLNSIIEKAKTDWILYIKDNEKILKTEEVDLTVPDVYGIQILKDDSITKEPRLFHKSVAKFKNPVFEKLNKEPSKILDIVFYQEDLVDLREKHLLNLWKNNQPLSIDANYYKAFEFLAEKQFSEFKSLILHYLFQIQTNDIPSVMARYYLAMIQGLVFEEIQESIKNLTICLASNPLMAEFWCLMGDLHMKMGKSNNAKAFYHNAICLGRRRLALDFWPMQISKYQSYPEEMIKKCKAFEESKTKYFSGSFKSP